MNKELIWNKKVLGSIVVVGALVSAGVFGLNGYFGGGEQGVPEDTWTRGLVAAYNFDEGSGQVAYNAADTGSVNNGTLGSTTGSDANDPVWSRSQTSNSSGSLTSAGSGSSGSALDFDGTDDYVDCGNDSSLNITDAITIEAWVKPADITTGINQIVSKYVSAGDNREFTFGLKEISSNDYIRVYITNSDATKDAELRSTKTISTNVYTHIVFRYDSSLSGMANKIKFYINGVSDTTVVISDNSFPGIENTTAILTIGSNGNLAEYFNGAIDGVKIYNRALSAEEVRYHYNRGGPVAHWGFDEGAGVNVYNSADTSAGAVGYPISAGLGNRIPAQYDGSIKSSALDFDGTDQYVDCGDPADGSLDMGTGDFSVEAWAKLGVSGVKGIISKVSLTGNQGFSISANGSSGIYVEIRDTGAGVYTNFNSTDITDGSWHHIIVVFDRSANAICYVDGAQSGDLIDITGQNDTISNSDNFRIGSLGPAYYFQGSIDEVRIYNKALHATTIANHYKGDYGTYEKTSAGAALTDDDLVLYIPFDDAGGDTATNYGDCGGTAANCNGDLTNYTAAEEVAKYGDTHDTGWVIDTDFTSARHNTGLDFGGVNGFFQSDSYIPAASSTSYSLWFKSSDGAYSANEYLFSQGNDDPSAYIDTSGNIKVMAEDGVLITSATTVLDTKWHHIETTADGTNMRLYIDGVLDGTAAYTGSSDDAGISAGAHISRSGFFNGIIDDLKVYAYARSPGEIRLDYNAGFAARMGPAGMTCSEDPASCMDYGLVASYDFDEGDGQTLYNAADTGSVNDGTLGSSASADSADPTWVASEGGSRASASGGDPTSAAAGGTALSFDGTNDYVNCGNDPSLDITGAITIEAWVYPTSYSAAEYKYIIYKAGAWHFQVFDDLESPQGIHFTRQGDAMSDDAKTSHAPISLNTWSHVVVTYQNITNGNKMYVNGILQDEATGGGAIPNTVTDLQIGWSEQDRYFNGSIDGVKIYNRALSAEEVRYHYNRGAPVAHWRMDEGEGSTAYDETSNNNDGTLHLGSLGNTATSSAWVSGKHSSAIDFDGTDDYVDCGSDSSLDITDAITVSAWVKTNTTSHGSIVSKFDAAGGQRSYRVSIDETLYCSAGYLSVAISSTAADWNGIIKCSDIVINDNDWHHIVVVFDGGNYVKIFINGIDHTGVTGLGSLPASIAVSTRNLAIGAGYSSSATPDDEYFNGTIDDVRIYNYARTPAQIQMDYNDGLAVHMGGSNQSSVINDQCSQDPASCMDHGLVASYDFDEGDGQTLYNAADTGSANDGTLGSSASADSADPTWASSDSRTQTSNPGSLTSAVGPSGTVLDFDGSNDYIDCGSDSSLNITDAITIEAWVKVTDLLGRKQICTKWENGEAWQPFITAGNVLRWRLRIGAGNSDLDYTLPSSVIGKWIHITFTHDKDVGAKLFIDGEQKNSNSVTGTIDASSGNVYIGTYQAAGGEYFNGSIDGVKIYNRALSVEEVRYHYNRGAPVAHWRMDEGEGSTAYDESSNNNDGTLHLGSLGNTATSSAWVTGKHGSAIDFDGEDDYIDCGSDSSLDIIAAITLSAWVKPAVLTGIQDIVFRSTSSPYKGYAFELYDGKPRVVINGADIQASDTAITTSWTHIVVSRASGGQYLIYVNGVEVTYSATTTTTITTNTADFVIGSTKEISGWTNRRFNGSIDDVRIYNYARTSAQIQMDYNAGFGTHLK